jgi:hypothetical protein
MEAMLGISLYSYPYLKLAKTFYIIAYVFSLTKLEKRAEQVLPGSEGAWEKERGCGVQQQEMTETMYVHMNI